MRSEDACCRLAPIRRETPKLWECASKIDTRAVHRRTIRQFWFELAFGSKLNRCEINNLELASLTLASWNPIGCWLRKSDGLRRAF
jgi:hypothetical protein